MKQKIIDFYTANGFLMTDIIIKRPAHLTVAQIEAAATELYGKIHRGEVEVKALNLVRKVYQEAEIVNFEAYKRDQEILDNVKSILKNLHTRCVQLMVLSWILALGLFIVTLMKV